MPLTQGTHTYIDVRYTKSYNNILNTFKINIDYPYIGYNGNICEKKSYDIYYPLM